MLIFILLYIEVFCYQSIKCALATFLISKDCYLRAAINSVIRMHWVKDKFDRQHSLPIILKEQVNAVLYLC